MSHQLTNVEIIEKVHKFPAETQKMNVNHIRSSKIENRIIAWPIKKIYLPKDLNLTNSYEIFKERHPNVKFSKESYHEVKFVFWLSS